MQQHQEQGSRTPRPPAKAPNLGLISPVDTSVFLVKRIRLKLSLELFLQLSAHFPAFTPLQMTDRSGPDPGRKGVNIQALCAASWTAPPCDRPSAHPGEPTVQVRRRAVTLHRWSCLCLTFGPDSFSAPQSPPGSVLCITPIAGRPLCGGGPPHSSCTTSGWVWGKHE